MPPVTSKSQRKQPCNGCRSRKKRCDTARPTCSNCRKWGLICDYTNHPRASQRLSNTTQDYNLHETTDTFTPPLDLALALPTDFIPTNDIFTQSTGISAFDSVWFPDPTTVQNNVALSGSAQPTTGIGADPLSEFTVLPSDPVTDAARYPFTEHAMPLNQGDSRSCPGVTDASNGQANTFPTPPESTEASASLSSGGLPPHSQLVELTELFFDQHYIFVPFLHKTRFLNTFAHFNRDHAHRRDAALLYAVIAIAAQTHPDAGVRNCQTQWFTKAKQLCEPVRERTYSSLQDMQASLCISLLAWITGDYPLSWLYLGKAWCQACTIGLNRIDGHQPGFFSTGATPEDAVEIEERRRTVWTLFIMDRGWAFPCGWPHAIDDRQYMVNFPVPDTAFQQEDNPSPEWEGSFPFSRNLRRVIMAVPQGGRISLLQAILKAYIILGRATEHVHSLQAQSDPEEHLREFHELDSSLSRFKLSLPREATTLQSKSIQDAAQVIWLNAVLSSITILLHLRPEPDDSSAVEPHPDVESPDVQAEKTAGFEHCITAARNICQLIKDATRVSIDVLINPHISSSLYLCSRILVFEWRATKSEETRADIEIFLLLFDRIEEVYPSLGRKFKKGISYDLHQDKDRVSEMRRQGARGLLSRCRDWSGANPQETWEKLNAHFGL